MKRLYTVAEVADHFGIEPHKVVRRCQDPMKPWPHLRPTNRSESWRFTEADIEDIEMRLARRVVEVTAAADSWGLSARSRRRAS